MQRLVKARKLEKYLPLVFLFICDDPPLLLFFSPVIYSSVLFSVYFCIVLFSFVAFCFGSIELG